MKKYIISAIIVCFLTVGPSILAGLVEIPQVFAVLTAILRIVGIAAIPVLSVLAVVLEKKEGKEKKAKERAHARYLAQKEFQLLERELNDFREERREEEVRNFFRTITADSFLPMEEKANDFAFPAGMTEQEKISAKYSYLNELSRERRASKV